MRKLRQFDEVDFAHQIDGLRFALVSADIAFGRVTAALEGFENSQARQIEIRDALALMADCWSHIDASHRSGRIAKRLRVLKRTLPERRDFLRTFEEITQARDFFHHVDEKAKALTPGTPPISGSIA